MKTKNVLGRPPINTVQLLENRCYFDVETMLRNRMQSASQFMQRLELEAILTGHEGCVNRLEWSASGRLLASVSDDTHVMIWDAFRHRRISDLQTLHFGNIFDVKFMPNTDDTRLATGAADCKVIVTDVLRGGESPVWSCTCHQMRVKSLATCPDNPHILWSSAEDGLILQFDLREKHVCRKVDEVLLINLNNNVTPHAEIKSIAINPRRPEMLAVGANDSYARVYDRRMLSLKPIKYRPAAAEDPDETFQRFFVTPPSSSIDAVDDKIPNNGCTYYSPGQFVKHHDKNLSMHKAITHLAFSADGTELLVNMGAEQIYLYDLKNAREPVFAHISSKLNSDASKTSPLKQTVPKSPAADALKKEGNRLLSDEKFLQAITQYTAAIRLAPSYPVLYLNRATALMRRNWNGDDYAALRDCFMAVSLDPGYVKAHFRLARALLKLGYRDEAMLALDTLVKQFPDYKDHQGVVMLRKDINFAIMATKMKDEANKPVTSEKELYWRSLAQDYAERFVGHCNTTTDIKEASFFGNDGNYIIAGSDDGNFFIWERKTNVITNIFKGDESIVNCVQPHPSVCLLATSGIDKVIRLWSPQREHSSQDVASFDGPVQRNQQRMQQDPFDMTTDRCTTS